MPGHELGASYKPVKKRWTGKVEYLLTATYEAGHEATFGAKPSRYCNGCGRLPSFCECPKMFGAVLITVDDSLPPGTVELRSPGKPTLRLENIV